MTLLRRHPLIFTATALLLSLAAWAVLEAHRFVQAEPQPPVEAYEPEHGERIRFGYFVDCDGAVTPLDWTVQRAPRLDAGPERASKGSTP